MQHPHIRERYRTVGLYLLVPALLVGGGNELAQRLVQRGVIEYHFLFGYVSDFCAVPFATGVVVATTGRAKLFLPVLFAVMYSLLELEGVRDPLDFAMYWISAAAVFVVLSIANRCHAIVGDA